jgi:2-amino-4-hydroxy-6-hydroxymethyldihydropteridine diphosphokinase
MRAEEGASMTEAMTQQHNAPRTHRVYLGLGSNLGDRDAHLAAAIRALVDVGTVERVSSVYDTAPMLITDQPRFHNIVAQVATDLAPLSLLHAVKQIERQLGRQQGPRYGPRVIDIDLLFYDDLTLNAPGLTLPHPRLAERRFVLAPLAEIAPTLAHPGLGMNITELLARLPADDAHDAQRVGPLPDSRP